MKVRATLYMNKNIIDRLLINLDKIALNHNDDNYGLPLYSDKQRELLEECVEKWLEENNYL